MLISRFRWQYIGVKEKSKWQWICNNEKERHGPEEIGCIGERKVGMAEGEENDWERNVLGKEISTLSLHHSTSLRT